MEAAIVASKTRLQYKQTFGIGFRYHWAPPNIDTIAAVIAAKA